MNHRRLYILHKEKLGHALSLNMMRCEAIHDGEIFPNHGVLAMLTMACAGGLRFFPGISSDTLTNRKCVII
jgi:hypothetical protein